jgi:AcrR family transcriptional regulator
LSTQTTRKVKSRPRGRRGLDKTAILEAAFEMLSQVGEVEFSVRKLGVGIGVDPMTVLHHFGSKDELLRRIADRALATVELPLPSADWRVDLRNVAEAYRDLAHRHPRLFHLHFRFHATGPADHASSEVVYRALRNAGLKDAEAAGLGLAFYAFILGYALAEAEGLLRPISDADEAELRALDPLACPATLALIPAFKALDRDAAFEASVDAFIEGVSCRCEAPVPRRPALGLGVWLRPVLVRRPTRNYKSYRAKAVSKSGKKARFANRISKKACLGANVPQSASNLKETGIFPLLIPEVFVLW